MDRSKERSDTIHGLFTIVFIVLLGWACLENTYQHDGGEAFGFLMLALGIFGIPYEFAEIGNELKAYFSGNEHGLFWGMGASICWLANPLLVYALLRVRSNALLSLRLCVIAFLLMLLFPVFAYVVNGSVGYDRIEAYLLGYYLWAASAVPLVMYSTLKYNKVI
jgi:hypothetical protein